MNDTAHQKIQLYPGGPEIEKAALKMGIKEFLLKPVDWEKLAQVVRTVLDRQAETKQ